MAESPSGPRGLLCFLRLYVWGIVAASIRESLVRVQMCEVVAVAVPAHRARGVLRTELCTLRAGDWLPFE